MSKVVSATFRRENIKEQERVPFHLYIDEFQNFINLAVSFDRLLSQSRKYRLVLHLANQYVDQLPRNIRSAIFGNVKTMVVFRVSPMDAQLLSSQFADFTPGELTSLDTGQAIARIGGSQDCFNLTCDMPLAPLSPSHAGAIIKRCRSKFATRLKEPVEDELICEQYLHNVLRFLRGKQQVNHKLMAAVEKQVGVRDADKWRKKMADKMRQLDERGEYFTAQTVPQLAPAFAAVWQQIQREKQRKAKPKAVVPKTAAAQFVLTHDWQQVPEGAVLPAGVEVRMNISEGVTYARLPSAEPTAGRIVPAADGKETEPAEAVSACDQVSKQTVPEPAEKEQIRPVEAEDAGGSADPDDDFQ